MFKAEGGVVLRKFEASFRYWGNHMKDEWLDFCIELSQQPADLYSGCRKILRGRRLTFENWTDDLQLKDAGYTSNKMRMLEKNYLHKESIAVAVQLWERRKKQAKYGSVSFTAFNHFVKGKGTVEEIEAKKSKRASIFGPCIQSVIITWLNKNLVEIDIAYRTTELLKKFPADLVFIRDVLLKPFDFSGMKVKVNFYFANITVHPQYYLTMVPHLEAPILDLEDLRIKDPFFHQWVVKWSSRYLCPEYHRGIQKFAQAMRVHKDVNERLSTPLKKQLQKYLRTHHPGFKKDYVDPDEEDEE